MISRERESGSKRGREGGREESEGGCLSLLRKDWAQGDGAGECLGSAVKGESLSVKMQWRREGFVGVQPHSSV
jgi:hypothetical protein